MTASTPRTHRGRLPTLLLAAVLVTAVSASTTLAGPPERAQSAPQGRAKGGVCAEAGLEGVLGGLCTAYCEALDCDAGAARGRERACARIRAHYEAQSGGLAPPCEVPAIECPCFSRDQVTSLIGALRDTSLYRALRCSDRRPANKPTTSVRAVRLDGARCSTASIDCGALSVEFTEDNVCQLNEPAPAPPVALQGISDAEREACREEILRGAESSGLACN